ncbi:MAG: universal stress protein [Alphaproteobacteria bacterium]|nr:universal stress protein [Alphaproteobacteria bacterium]
MPIKNLLVVVSGADGEETRLDTAVALAGKHGASVAALYVKPTAVIYSGGMGFEMSPALIEAQERDLEAAAKEAEAAVKAYAARSKTAIEWRCEEGDEVAVAAIHARYADLVVATPDLARDLVFAAGGPVLAVPDGVKANPPKRVLVAWNGGREAARALRDAADLLAAAGSATVVVIDPPPGKPIGQDIARFLAAHGIKTEVREMVSRGAGVGGLLLEEARTGGADLLVMGAYGHSRFREWVLGGATEEVLSDSKLPVLLSH